MRLSTEQHAELSKFVAADDRHKVEQLIDAICHQRRRQEAAAMETLKRRQRQSGRQWIPERL